MRLQPNHSNLLLTFHWILDLWRKKREELANEEGKNDSPWLTLAVAILPAILPIIIEKLWELFVHFVFGEDEEEQKAQEAQPTEEEEEEPPQKPVKKVKKAVKKPSRKVEDDKESEK